MNIKLVITAIIILLVVTSPSYSAKKALLIGIGDYPHVSKLVGPQQDVTNMVGMLKRSLGFEATEIKTLIDSQASRQAILSTLEEWVVKDTQPNDVVVFYYSGHGFQTSDKNGDELDYKDEAIAPYDAQIEGKEVVNMITDDEMEHIFARLDDRAVTIIIDSCHSGTLTRGIFDAENQQYEKTISEFNQLALPAPDQSVIRSHRQERAFIDSTPRRVVWTAVSAWQKALVDFERKNGSVFTNLFIAGIGDKKADSNRDEVVSRAELLEFIRSESRAFCERNRNNCRSGLTPTLEVAKDLFVESAVDFTNIVSANHANVVGTENSVTPDTTIDYVTESLVREDNDQLQMVIAPRGGKFNIGDQIGFEVTSKASGYLVLLDIDALGRVTQIFPNKFTDKKNTDGFIRANQKLILPNKSEYGFDFFQAQAPVGRGKLVAIVTQDKVLPDDVSLNKDLVVIDKPRDYVQNIVQSLNSVWTDGERNRAVSWSTAAMEYEIYQ